MGITASTTELNYGWSYSSIQDQLNGKQPSSGITPDNNPFIAKLDTPGTWELRPGGADGGGITAVVTFPNNVPGYVGVFGDSAGRPNLANETIGDLPLSRLGDAVGLSVFGNSANLRWNALLTSRQ